jgi:hypothetical protein
MQKTMGFLLSAVFVVALALGGYWLVHRTERHDICRICRREIHVQASAVAELDGKPEPVCCVRCALTLAHQQGKPVRLLQVTDYVSRQLLSLNAAYYVEGSRVILCEKHEPLLGESKEAFQRVFDRCEPSLYAFARREEAESFAARNGGVVVRLEQVLKEVEPRP